MGPPQLWSFPFPLICGVQSHQPFWFEALGSTRVKLSLCLNQLQSAHGPFQASLRSSYRFCPQKRVVWTSCRTPFSFCLSKERVKEPTTKSFLNAVFASGPLSWGQYIQTLKVILMKWSPRRCQRAAFWLAFFSQPLPTPGHATWIR